MQIITNISMLLIKEVILYSAVFRCHLTRMDITAPQVILEWLQHKLLDTPQAPPTNDSTASQQVVHSDTHRSDERETCTTVARFWALSPHFLAGISAQSVDCYRLIYKLLSSRVNQLQTQVMQEFEKNRDTYSDSVFSEELENEVLPHFRALLTTNDKVREVTVALVVAQVEETAAKVLAVGSKEAPILSTNTALNSQQPHTIKLPINLWRKILAIGN